jgi:hypothetical protein
VAGRDKAVDLTIKAAAAGGSKAWGLIRQSADNKAVRTAVTKAGEKAATLDDRTHRLLAMDLARQIGGEGSLRTVIAGERYDVVWRGDEPVDSFPMLPEKAGSLAGRPELSGFVGRRVAPSPN